jgi:hypothetical protein
VEQGGMSDEGKREMKGKLFRFQDLDIWKKEIKIGDNLLDIADELEKKKLYRFAEQIRGASLSISNNTWPVK